MANPNIVEVSSIYANNNFISAGLGDSSETYQLLINNPAGSGKVFKVNSISVANTTSGNVVFTSIKIFSEDDLVGDSVHIVNEIPVPYQTTLIVTDKETTFYLLENQSVGVYADEADGVAVTTSWEEIS